MNTWSPFIAIETATALHGGVNEVSGGVIDTHILRILERKIRNVSMELKQSRDSLASIMARQKLSAVQCEKIGALVVEHQGCALQALAKGNEELASELAEKIATLENHLANAEASCDRYAVSAAELKLAVEHATRDLTELEYEVEHVKATGSVQKAQTAVAIKQSASCSKIIAASESPECIKETQPFKAAQVQTASELARDSILARHPIQGKSTTYTSLERKLQDTGITSSGGKAKAVLHYLRKTNS